MSYWEKAQKAMYIVGDSFCHTCIRMVSHSARGRNVVQCGTVRCAMWWSVKRKRNGETEKQKRKRGRVMGQLGKHACQCLDSNGRVQCNPPEEGDK